MIQKWPEDWLKESLGNEKNMENPALMCDKIRKTQGRKAAMIVALQNSVRILSIIELYENIPSGLKSSVKHKSCWQKNTSKLSMYR